MILYSLKGHVWSHPLIDHLLLLKQELLLLLLLHHSLLKNLLELNLDLFRQLILLNNWLTIFIEIRLFSKLSRYLGISFSCILKKLNYLLSR